MISIKKVFASLLVFTVCIPFANTYAANSAAPGGHGSWDYKGEQKFSWYSNIVKSGGGDFAFCLKNGPSGYYTLYEDDSSSNPSDRVGSRYLSKGKCAIFKNVNEFVDGSGGQAEFYVVKSKNSGKATVTFWD